MYCGYLLRSTIRVIRKCCDDTLKEKENRNHTLARRYTFIINKTPGGVNVGCVG